MLCGGNSRTNSHLDTYLRQHARNVWIEWEAAGGVEEPPEWSLHLDVYSKK